MAKSLKQVPKPTLYVFLLTRIKKDYRLDLIEKKDLSEGIGRLIIRSGGLPRFMIKYIIEDMVKLGMIECVNNRELYRLKSCPEEKKIAGLCLF